MARDGGIPLNRTRAARTPAVAAIATVASAAVLVAIALAGADRVAIAVLAVAAGALVCAAQLVWWRARAGAVARAVQPGAAPSVTPALAAPSASAPTASAAVAVVPQPLSDVTEPAAASATATAHDGSGAARDEVPAHVDIAVHRALERFRLAFHSAPTGVMLLGGPGLVLLDANAALCRMLGRTGDEILGRALAELVHPDEAARPHGHVEGALAHASGASAGMEVRYLRADGEVVWARVSLTRLDDDAVDVPGGGSDGDGDGLVLAHVEDITAQRRSDERLQYAATHDQLTALPNRARFLELLRERLVNAPVGAVAVLFIDLDNFKVINDSLGHAVGDELLREMSERLRSVVRDRDTLGRFGGDEFMVMLDTGSDSGSPEEIAERLRQLVGTPLLIDDNELYVTASIGIARAARRGVTADELLRDADAAMYRAKSRGRDCVEAFAPGSHESSVLALRTTNELRHGLERGEIVPYYQPIVDLTSGRLTGFEVLARWRHPDRGLVGPDQFLPMAEETGLIAEVGLAVLRSSLSQVGRWRAHHPAFTGISLSVNVSVRQLVDGRFLGHVADALGESGLEADALWLEITETALMSDVKAATVALRELRSLGLHLAVDDFGTGYSSLTYLKRFPVEAIKVDRSFVNGLGIDTEDTTIVEAVINLGHSLGLMVVAEGVETPLQLSRLREIGCERGQGYLFGRPRPAELIEAERAGALSPD